MPTLITADQTELYSMDWRVGMMGVIGAWHAPFIL